MSSNPESIADRDTKSNAPRLARILDPRRRKRSPTTIPLTPPSGFHKAVMRPMRMVWCGCPGGRRTLRVVSGEKHHSCVSCMVGRSAHQSHAPFSFWRRKMKREPLKPPRESPGNPLHGFLSPRWEPWKSHRAHQRRQARYCLYPGCRAHPATSTRRPWQPHTTGWSPIGVTKTGGRERAAAWERMESELQRGVGGKSAFPPRNDRLFHPQQRRVWHNLCHL